MSTICIDKTDLNVQNLATTIDKNDPNRNLKLNKLYTEISLFVEKHNRMPRRDELSEADSEPYINELLLLKDGKFSDISTLLAKTGSNTIEEVAPKLNQEYSDLDIHLTPLSEGALLDIKHRPTDHGETIQEYEYDGISDIDTFNDFLDKLYTDYGIPLILTDTASIKTNKELSSIRHDIHTVNGFIYNNNVYINTDNVSSDVKLHELGHLFLGSMRYTNPDLYFNLVNTVLLIPEYNLLLNLYGNRTLSDVNEEIFITELSKKFAGYKSIFDTLNDETLYEINYQVSRILDTLLDGLCTSRILSTEGLFNMSIKELAKLLGSSLIKSKFSGSMNDAQIHRILNNVKADLLKKGDLIELC